MLGVYGVFGVFGVWQDGPFYRGAINVTNKARHKLFAVFVSAHQNKKVTDGWTDTHMAYDYCIDGKLGVWKSQCVSRCVLESQ